MNNAKFDEFYKHLSRFFYKTKQELDAPSSRQEKRLAMIKGFNELGHNFAAFMGQNTKSDSSDFNRLTLKGESATMKTDFEAALERKFNAFYMLINSTIKLDGGKQEIMKRIDSGLKDIRTFLVNSLCSDDETEEQAFVPPPDAGPFVDSRTLSTPPSKSDSAPASSWDTIRHSGRPSNINVKARTVKSNGSAWDSIAPDLQTALVVDSTEKSEGDGSSWDRIRQRNTSGIEAR